MIAKSPLHSTPGLKRSGRLSPSCCSGALCPGVAAVMRRRRISRPSAAGKMISALCNMDNRASAFIGDRGSVPRAPLADGYGLAGARRLSGCLRVTHRA